MDTAVRLEVRRIIEYFAAEYGKIDVLVNNAGINRPSTVKRMTDLEWDSVIGVNLTGVYNVSRACLRHMEKGSSIVNVGSVMGKVGGYGAANYSASKGGVIAFTKALAKELAKDNIRVNAVSPGFIETDLLREIPEKVRENLRKKTLLKRFGTPEEVAKFIVFLSVEGTYCTGQSYLVDGGYIS